MGRVTARRTPTTRTCPWCSWARGFRRAAGGKQCGPSISPRRWPGYWECGRPPNSTVTPCRLRFATGTDQVRFHRSRPLDGLVESVEIAPNVLGVLGIKRGKTVVHRVERSLLLLESLQHRLPLLVGPANPPVDPLAHRLDGEPVIGERVLGRDDPGPVKIVGNRKDRAIL